jgi:ATP-binding cassette subfamily B protein
MLAAAMVAGAVLASVVDYQVEVLDGRYAQAVHRAVAHATLHTSGIAELGDPDVAGDLAALEEFERVDGFTSAVSSLRTLVTRRATGIGAFALLFTFTWWAPLVMLAAWRGLSFGVRRWIEHGMRLSTSAGAGEMRRSRYLRGLAMEPAAAKEIRVFGLADWLVRGYADTYLAALRGIWQARRLGMRSVVLATGGVFAAHLLVLGVLGFRAATGSIGAAELVVVVQAVLGSAALGYVFGAEIPLARDREVALQVVRLTRRLAGPVAPAPVPTNGPVAIELRDVRFTYPGSTTPVLDGLDLTVPPGQSLAIVGVNGAGKSTLVKLLCGLYEPDAGHIQLGGVPAPEARGSVAAIFQQFTRYELPLRANVGFGGLGCDERDLTAALADAGADDLLDVLPQGWDTVLSSGSPGGHDLSGGQWQKVALARALAAVRSGAGMLIMDEPTASLDVRAEAELFTRLLERTAGVTTILVSHRLSSVRRADRIVVVSGGRVSEDGTHAELMAAGGRYAEMFTLQARRFTEGAGAGGNGYGHG